MVSEFFDRKLVLNGAVFLNKYEDIILGKTVCPESSLPTPCLRPDNIGTADVQVRGHDPTGKSVIEGFFGPSVEDALSCYDRVVATKAPVLDPVPFTATNGRYATEETIFLPLSDDGINVNKIVVFFAFVDVLEPGSVVQLDL